MAKYQSHEPPLAILVAKSAGIAGLGTGLVGVAVGGIAGLFRSNNPGLFAIASGAQCFTLGFVFTASRRGALEVFSQIQKTPITDLQARDIRLSSALGGAAAGGFTANLFRGRANVLPGMLVWGVLGLAGQVAVDVAAPKIEESQKQSNGPGLIERIASSKWSPMTRLSDEEYERMLKERLLRVEAEIALVDEDIAKVEDPSRKS